MPKLTTRPALPVGLTVSQNRLIKPIQFFAEGSQGYGPWSALLEHGQFFEPARTLPEWLTRGNMGECYANSTRSIFPYLAVDPQPYFYVEGYALEPDLGIPFEHAWIVNLEGTAYDLTWTNFHKATYFGVRFDTKFLLRSMRKNKCFGLLWNLEAHRDLYASRKAFRAALGDTSADRLGHRGAARDGYVNGRREQP